MKTLSVLFCLAVLTVVVGCSKTNDSAQAQGPASAPAPVAAPPAAAVTPAAVPAPPPPTTPAAAATQPAAPASAPKSIGTADGTIPGTRIEVTELKRSSGGTVTLRFTIVNESKTTLDMSAVGAMLDMPGGYTVANVHLIDPVGRKKYFTAKDAEGKCVCSVYGFVKPGERFNHWAKFPAPPDDVERLSVVFPTFAPADDVPISR